MIIHATPPPTPFQIGSAGDFAGLWRQKVCAFLADVVALGRAVDLISEGYFDNHDLLFEDVKECGTSIAGGATCTISVTFDPTAAGVLSAAVTLSDNAPSKFQKVPLSGVGVLPAVKLSSASITFPKQVVFTTSAAQTVMLTNTGLGILNIAKITATGPFSQTNNCGSPMNPGASCTVSVAFSPKTIGTLTGSITFTDNAPSKTQKSY